jgi:hypothetical protein
MIAPSERHATVEASETRDLLAAARAARDARRRREQVFGDELLAEPCWDLLLDLFIAAQEGKRLSITAACLALPVPRGTAQRCIAHLADVGLISRETGPGDHGVLYLAPTDRAVAKLTLLLSRPDRDEEMNAA